MKKIKLIPSLILLALCIAILGIGIYAAAPAGNTITGTVTITAANAPVSIALYDTPSDYVYTNAFGTGTTKKGDTRTGGLSLAYNPISFDASGANTLEDVAPITKLIVVKNNSATKDLGVYFQDKLGSYAIHSSYDAPEQATMTYDGSYNVTASDIIYGNQTTHYNPVNPAVASALNGKVRLDCTFYSHVAPGAMVEMFVQFSLLDLDTDVAATALNLYLTIEEYQPTASGTYTGFVKWNPSISSSQVSAPEANLDDDLVYPNGPADPPAPVDPYNNYKAGLVALVVPQGVEYLGGEDQDEYFGFMNECSKLVACSIPNTVESCYESIMNGCSRLVSITIPYSLTSGLSCDRNEENRSFAYCTNLSCIMVDPNNSAYDSRNNCNAIIGLVDGYKDESAKITIIAGCKNTVIPNTVQRILSSAFAGSGLTSITIPNSITSFYDNPFSYCEDLTTINYFSTTGWTLPDDYEDEYHWEYNGNTVTSISSGSSNRGTYIRVENS